MGNETMEIYERWRFIVTVCNHIFSPVVFGNQSLKMAEEILYTYILYDTSLCVDFSILLHTKIFLWTKRTCLSISNNVFLFVYVYMLLCWCVSWEGMLWNFCPAPVCLLTLWASFIIPFLMGD